MDHSLRGYLSRRETEELEQLLAVYQSKQEDAWDAGIAEILREILDERKKQGI